MNVYITNPHGFSLAISRAIKMAEQIKENHPHRPVAFLGGLVQDEDVINYLQNKGVFSLYNPQKTAFALLEEVNPETIIIFPPSGHDKRFEDLCLKRGITYFDATSPRVTFNQNLLKEALNRNDQIIFIGTSDHPETQAVLSISPKICLYDLKKSQFSLPIIFDRPTFISYQTTYSRYDLAPIYAIMQRKFPHLTITNEVSSDLRLRQEAILNLPPEVDLLYIIGNSFSYSTNNLMDLAKKTFPRLLIRLIKNKANISSYDLKNKKLVALATGSSTPNYILEAIIEYLKSFR